MVAKAESRHTANIQGIISLKRTLVHMFPRMSGFVSLPSFISAQQRVLRWIVRLPVCWIYDRDSNKALGLHANASQRTKDTESKYRNL